MAAPAAKIRVLVVHTAYRQRGGEDVVCEAEIDLLRSRGHAVELFVRHNYELSATRTMRAVRETVWSSRAVATMTQLMDRFAPDVVHVHNTFPLISPSIYWVASKRGVPVVQTLHNFRLLCPQAMFLRDNRVCEECIGRFPWSGVVHRCYRGSLAHTSVLAGMLGVHRAIGTYRNKVTRYIALTEYSRLKFIEGGVPPNKIDVKPNFVDLPSPPDRPREGFLFVGRLSREKGIDVLVESAELSMPSGLRVAGSGPEAQRLEGIPGVALLGAICAARVREEMTRAIGLVLPSICYENFPRTVVEAFACGLPVIASRIGSLAELVHDNQTGLLFEAGNAHDLAAKIAWAHAHPARMREMGCNARARYEASYASERNYVMLLGIYENAIAQVNARGA